MSQLEGDRARTDFTCPGYLGEPSKATGGVPAPETNPPAVTFRGASVRIRGQDSGAERAVELHESIGAWTLMSVSPINGVMTAIFEEVGRIEGRIAFVCADGVRLELPKSLEPTDGSGAGWYQGHTKAEVLPAGDRSFLSMRESGNNLFPGQPDVLRYELLAGGKDPDPEHVRRCFPPLRRNPWEGHERPHTFIGSPISIDVIPLYYPFVDMVWRVPISVVAPGSAEAVRAENLWEGLVGGWLPVVRTVYPMGDHECWEMVVFADVQRATPFMQPAWYRFLKLRNGRIIEAKYVDSFLPYPVSRGPDPSDFYRALFGMHGYWDAQLEGAARVTAPERWIDDFARHSIALERITRRGDHPKYGINDRAYGGEEHDGFQDLLTSTVTCNTEWGLFSTARTYLDYYFRHFVRPDGSIFYRGPQIGKYGQMLSCLAQYADYTEDYALVCEHDQKVKAIVDLLLRRWQDARRVGPGSAEYGMIKGYHEADINFLTPNVNELDYERPFLANSAQAWRGLRDIADTWKWIGERRNDREMAERAAKLEREAADLFIDARRGVERSWIEKDGVTGLPIIAGSNVFYWEALYRSCPEAYDENRAWAELFWSGVLAKESVEKILEMAGSRGGTTLGIFTNRYHIVGFLVSEAVHGLLQHDLVPEALLAFYAHAFHAHTRGTWTVRECVDLDRDSGYSTPYCNPAQMTVPTIAKWLLVFEDPLDRTITLGRGIPRAWFEDGKEFGIENAPTRFGHVSFRVRSRLTKRHIEADITLPPRAGAAVRLRLRCPEPDALERVDVLNRDDLVLRVKGDTVIIPKGALGKVSLRVWCAEDGARKGPGN